MVIEWTPTTELIPCQVQPEPAHEPWYPFSGRMLQKWHFLAIAGGKAIMYILDVIQNLLNNVTAVIP